VIKNRYKNYYSTPAAYVYIFCKLSVLIGLSLYFLYSWLIGITDQKTTIVISTLASIIISTIVIRNDWVRKLSYPILFYLVML